MAGPRQPRGRGPAELLLLLVPSPGGGTRRVTRLRHVSPLARVTRRPAPPLVLPWNPPRDRAVLYVAQQLLPAARLVALLPQGPPQLRLAAGHSGRGEQKTVIVTSKTWDKVSGHSEACLSIATLGYAANRLDVK